MLLPYLILWYITDIILIILSIISITKNINEASITERLGNLEKNTIKELAEFKSHITKDQNENFNRLNNDLHNDFVKLNDKMEEKLRGMEEKIKSSNINKSSRRG